MYISLFYTFYFLAFTFILEYLTQRYSELLQIGVSLKSGPDRDIIFLFGIKNF